MIAQKNRLSAEIVAYCADCDSDYAESAEKHLGKNFLCPNNQKHLATVVKGKEGRYWLWVESKLLCYQLKYSPSQCFSSSGYWVFVRFFLFLLTLGIAAYLPKSTAWGFLFSTVLVLLVLYLVFDIVAVNTSIAFTSRSPANPLRTAFLALLSFFSVALAFSTLYALMPSCFVPPLNPIRAVYFSFITITTIGYGDFKPLADSWLAQVIIIFEIMIGAYFLVILAAIFSSWVNIRPLYSCERFLEDVRVSQSSTKDDP